MSTRRQLLQGVTVIGAKALLPRWVFAADGPSTEQSGLPEGALETSVLEALPGKQPLIKRSYRPPNYETPVEGFGAILTPNDRFFIRYHLPWIPVVAANDWKLQITGDSVEKPLTLTLASLQRDFEQVELVAVCQCSGDRRGLSSPHVPGVQWGPGAMGNAKWRGVRLRDVLAKVGVRREALEVTFNGSDFGAMQTTPDYRKSLPVWKAVEENTLLAWDMNGAPLPHFNGAPVRLVVPGWTATYWMKHVVSIRVVSRPLKNFWMASAYRIPKGKFPVVDRFISQESETTMPITDMVVNSLITNLRDGQKIALGQPVEVRGIAWDAGYGVRTVEVSTDGGQSWREAELETDVGRFSFRGFRYGFRAEKMGALVVMAKATNRMGSSQTFELIFNPGGYHNNVVSRVNLAVA